MVKCKTTNIDYTTMLIYYIAILLQLIFIKRNVGKSSYCDVTREENQIINIKKSRATSNNTRAIKGLNLTDESFCKDKCCENAECTVYVYYNSKQRQFNCFLIQCKPVSNCVRSYLHDSVVGTMKRTSDNFIHPSQVTSFKSKQGVTLETSITQTPIDTSPTTMEQPAQRGVKSSPTSANKLSAPSMSPSLESTGNRTVLSPTASTNVIHTQQVNATTYKERHTGNPASQHNHTNKISLVIALFFGVLFLLAVIVIVGRPWWEFIQRPRYSKVDYLMNGL